MASRIHDRRDKDPFETSTQAKIESRRSLHAHALDALARGWSAAEWETWSGKFATALVELLGPRELEAIVRMVWFSARRRRW